MYSYSRTTMRKLLSVVFILSLFAGIAQAADIDIDVTNSRLEIINATTIRLHNVSATSALIPSGNYWADFQWDPANFLFVPVNYGEEPTTDYECPPLPSPPANGEFMLVFNAGTQSKMDCLVHGQTKYYTFTIPAGFTRFSMNVSSISQTANLDMVIVQSAAPVDTATLDAYLGDAVDYYTAHPADWGVPYYRNYPPPVWAKMGTDFGGEGIYLDAGASNGIARTVSVPGTYYVAVKNESAAATATYYIYAKQ